MEFGSLWLPVVLSTLAVFIWCSLAWTVLPHHKKDWAPLPDEESVRKALLEQGAGPGQYRVPYCNDMSAIKDPEFMRRYQEGPVANIHIDEPRLRMGSRMVKIAILYFIIAFFVAYIARHSLVPSSPAMDIFRMTFVTTLGFHTFMIFPDAIWKAAGWGTAWRTAFDGLVNALLTATLFTVLWPG